MKKFFVLLLMLVFASGNVYAAVGKETKGPFGYNLYDDINRKPDDEKAENNEKTEQPAQKEYYGDATEPAWEKEEIYYPNATLNSPINKYKNGNYSGCLQEMISLTKKDASNPLVYYYLGMAYTQVGNKDQAVKAYETVMKLHPDNTLVDYARKGRDCLVGGPTCVEPKEDELTDLDKFINSPYGNGFSDELNEQIKQQKLKDIQKTINKKQRLEDDDIEKIQNFDDKHSEIQSSDKIAEVSDDEILKAIKTLKNAGITVSITPQNPYNDLNMLMMNNSNSFNMVPFMLSQYENGQKIDPQIIQSMMLNSMLPDFTFKNDDKY